MRIHEGADRPFGKRVAGPTTLLLVFYMTCIGPRLGRLAHPSLIADDVGWLRIAVSEGHLEKHFFAPFNDHISPLFVGWTRLLWELSGRRLAQMPLALTAGAYVPFFTTLWLVRSVVRRELASESAGLVAVAFLSLSTYVYDETIYWYAASSFMWALALTLAAWLCAASARASGSRLAWAGATLASAAAPCFSLIGLLAGPIASLRGLLPAPRALDGSGRCRWACAWPILGLLFYLAMRIVVQPRHTEQSFVARLRCLGDFEVIQSILRSPLEVLIPAILGFYHDVPLPNILGSENVHELPWGLVLALSTMGLGVAVVWSLRASDRALVLIGLILIYPAYALTLSFPFQDRYCWRLSIERYHLFPHLGLVLLITAAAAPLLRRLEGIGLGRFRAAMVLAAGLLATHSAIPKRTRLYRAPDQVRTLAAMDKVTVICRLNGISREQAIAAFDPVSRKSWFPHDALGVHSLLQLLMSPVEEARLPDSQVRSTLLAALSTSEVESLCGGADLSQRMVALERDEAGRKGVAGALVASHRLEDRGGGLYAIQGWDPERGWPAFLEYRFAAAAIPTRPSRLDLPATTQGDLPGGASIEVWWAGDEGDWTVFRSVHWRLGPTRNGWSLPLERLPHWHMKRIRRIRIVFRTPGVLALRPPRLV